MKNELYLLIKEQQKEHNRLLELSMRLATLAKKEKPEKELELLMNERQEIIAGIDRNWKKLKNAPEEEAPGMMEKIGKTIEKILEMDRTSSEILQKRSSKMAENMKSINKGSVAVKSYGRGKSGGSGRFISIRK